MVGLVYYAHHTEVYDRIFLQYAQYQSNYFYPDAEDFLSPKIPKTSSYYVNISTYVDEYHAVNLATCRYHAGILLYLNN